MDKETTQSLTAGQVLSDRLLRSPTLVRRGEVVDVLSLSPGIRVRTKARARQEGGAGDVVEVESLFDRKTFLTRVSGLQQVEVYARAVPAGGNP